MSEEAYPLAAPEDLRRYRHGRNAVYTDEHRAIKSLLSALDHVTRLLGQGWQSQDAAAEAQAARDFAERVLSSAPIEPRPITDAMVEAAASIWLNCELSALNSDDLAEARAALEAAEKARVT